MHKAHSPVLIPGALTALDEIDAISKAVELLEHSAAPRAFQFGRRFSSLGCELHAKVVNHPSPLNLTHVIAAVNAQHDLFTGSAKRILDLHFDSRIFITGYGNWPSSLSLPAVNTLVVDDEGLPSKETTEVASLRQEVDELRRQVTVLTGLVQLRAEPPSDPLAAAKSRGASYMKAEFERADNLSLAAASEYSGRSDRMINLERNRGALYALILEGNTRGYRYPKWQFDVPSARLRSVLDVLTVSSISCWSIHNFLTRPHSDLDGWTPSVAIGDNEFPIERIIAVAHRRVEQQQGAS